MSATLIHPNETGIVAANYINGEWVPSDQTFQSLNPANRDHIVGTVPRATPAQVDEAVKAARSAFHDWKNKSWIQRGEYVDHLAQLIKRDVEELARMVTIECGKPINEGRADVIEALHMAQYVAGLSRLPIGHVISSEIPAKDAFILRKPKGVVACITPWNFPFAIPLWGILPAVLAGNTVVFKPSEETPIVAHKLMKLFEEAGFPRGVVNIVHGMGEDTGDALVKNPDVNVVLFTGSLQVGKIIQRQAATEVHKFVVTETGGKNATIVLADADLDIAVNAAVLGGFKTAGQRCVTSGRLIVDRSLLDKFTDAFVEKVNRIVVGDGLRDDVFMGPLINPEGIAKWQHHNAKAVEEGGRVLVDGKVLDSGDTARGNFVSPFVYRFDQYKPDTFCLKEEAFSPHVAIIGVDGMEEAVRVYNDTKYGLAMACITEDYRKWRYVRDNAEFGLGYINLPSIGAEVHLPFGGIKGSGNGHPAAEGALDAVTHRVAFTVNHAHEIVMAQGLSAKL